MTAGEFFALVLTAAVLFSGTNVDDIVALTVLNISSRAAGRPGGGTSGWASTRDSPSWSPRRWPPRPGSPWYRSTDCGCLACCRWGSG
jgi:hypothetical protein